MNEEGGTGQAARLDDGTARLSGKTGTSQVSRASSDRANSELRWEERGPVAYIEGLSAPLYLSKIDIQKNIPNFQGLFLDQLAKSPNLSKLRYIDLRWDDEIAVGEPQDTAPPAQKALPPGQ